MQRYEFILNLQKELMKQNKSDILSDTVDEESIGSIISKWTSIPVQKLVGSERDKLLNLENNLLTFPSLINSLIDLLD